MQKNKMPEAFDEIKRTVITDPRKAEKMACEMLADSKKRNDSNLEAYANYCLAECAYFLGRRESTVVYANKALLYFRRTDDYLMQCRCYNLIGIVYSSIEDYQIAVNSLLSALDIAEHHRIGINKYLITNNIGVIYARLEDYATAMKYLKRGYNAQEKRKRSNQGNRFISCYNMLATYVATEDYDSAQMYLDIIINDKLCKSPSEELLLHEAVAQIEYGKGNLDKGDEAVRSIFRLLEGDVPGYDVHEHFFDLATMLIKLNKLDYAKRFIEILDAEQAEDFLHDQEQGYELKTEYYAALGDVEKEYEYYCKLYDLSKEKEKEQAERQIQMLNQKQKMQREIFVYQQEAEKAEQFKLLSQRDGLTELMNRNSLNRLLELWYAKALKQKMELGCIFIDLDCLKEYNDTYGHTAGDECIKMIAEICKALESENLKFARYGGDEFLGVVLGKTDSQLEEIAEDIRQRLHRMHMEHKNSRVSGEVTVSMGLVNVCPDANTNVTDLINYADKALYQSKECGRNRVSFIR